jgi:hypothetical protein
MFTSLFAMDSERLYKCENDEWRSMTKNENEIALMRPDGSSMAIKSWSESVFRCALDGIAYAAPTINPLSAHTK